MPLFEGAWSTNEITWAERVIADMTYAEANMYLCIEMGFDIVMASALIGLISQRQPKSRLAAHSKYLSLT